jgi:hypothetical protein
MHGSFLNTKIGIRYELPVIVIVYAIFDRHEANIRTALEIYFILK